MLVLSRRPNEKIILPSINTTIQVVSIKPGVVRLGIEAPAEVMVYREELVREPAAGTPPRSGSNPSAASLRWRGLDHQVRNRLSAATTGLATLRGQLGVGPSEACASTLDQVDQEFQALRLQFEQVLSQETPRSRPRKALLVEDDHNERELLAGFLRLAGLDVVTADNGCSALRFLRDAGRPDILLLDMVMPRCDGPSTIREIRRDPRLTGLKIFAISGHDPHDFGLTDHTTVIDRWFSKPLNPEVLLSDLHRDLADVP